MFFGFSVFQFFSSPKLSLGGNWVDLLKNLIFPLTFPGPLVREIFYQGERIGQKQSSRVEDFIGMRKIGFAF